MATPVVRLGAQDLGGDFTYGWELDYGTGPSQQTFLLSAARALALTVGQPITLEVTPGGNRPQLKVEKLYVLEVGAGPSPNQRTVRVADSRWLWASRWVSARFNVPRASGDTSLQTEDGQPVELAQTPVTTRFAKWSLDPPGNDGTLKWTARRVLEYVFGEIGQEFRVVGALPDTDIFNLSIEGNGASAVEQALERLPGCDVYMDLDGVAVVQDATTPLTPGGTRTKDSSQFPALQRRHVFLGGDVVLTNRNARRPSKVAVLFDVEQEIRFDSLTEDATRTGLSAADTPTLINVCPSPDLTLLLTEDDPNTIPNEAVTVARGTYVPLDKLMTAWGAVFGFSESGGAGERELSLAVLAQYGTSASLLEERYVRASAAGLYSVANGARVQAAVQSWRRLYQIDETYMQRLSSIRATRVAIINPSTGLRAPSQVYCDFLRRPNEKNPEARGHIPDFQFGWYARGYATLLADCKAAPATVSVVSETAGIIRLDPKEDPRGKTTATLLGYPLDSIIPSNVGDAESNRTGTRALSLWARCQLTTDFQVAVVLTCVPASPNNTNRLHKVEITASEAGSDGSGPPMTIRILPSLLTARFAWNDSQSATIRDSVLNGGVRPENLCVNKADLKGVAMAAAKAVYSSLADTPDTRSGAVSVDMNPALKPTGAFGRVRHGLNGGLTTTQVMATGIRRPTDIWRFMDTETRRVVLRNGLEIES